MYLPSSFIETRPDVLHQFIRENPFGALVAQTRSGLDANHFPMVLDTASSVTLTGHMARANPFWQECDGDTPALVLFGGPHAYISPSWYPSKAQHGKVVPTWNYIVVHAHGSIRFSHDRDALLQNVGKLTSQQEAARSHPWKVSDAPQEYVERLLEQIVLFRITIDRIVGKWKVSQNRADPDQRGVLAGLRGEGTAGANALAAAMEALRGSSQPGS